MRPTPLRPLWYEMPLTGLRPAAQEKTSEVKGAAFTDIFTSAIDAVRETDAQKTQLEYLTATGQIDNPALLTIASSKAQLAVDLLVQLRNKALDAYKEIHNINM